MSPDILLVFILMATDGGGTLEFRKMRLQTIVISFKALPKDMYIFKGQFSFQSFISIVSKYDPHFIPCASYAYHYAQPTVLSFPASPSFLFLDQHIHANFYV